MARVRSRLTTEVQKIIQKHRENRRELRVHLNLEVSGNLLSRMQLSGEAKEKARKIIAHQLRISEAQHQIPAAEAVIILKRGLEQLSEIMERRKDSGNTGTAQSEIERAILQRILAQLEGAQQTKLVQLEPNILNKLDMYNEIELLRALGTKNFEKYQRRMYCIKKILSK